MRPGIWSPKAGCRRETPLQEWPLADRLGWQRAIGRGEFFDTASPAAGWAPETYRVTEQSYGTWLSWLRWNGRLDPDRSGVALATPGRVRRYGAELRGQLSPSTVCRHFFGLHTMAAILRPTEDWAWLKRICLRMRSQLDPTTFRQGPTIPSAELLRLGVRLMVENDHRTSHRPVFQTIRFRDGLMIALLAARPVRLRNFASLRIGQNLIRTGGRWHYVFNAAETKSARALTIEAPSELGPFFERYIEHHRPLLRDVVGRGGKPPARAPGNELWLTVFGTAMTRHSLSLVVAQRTLNLLSARVSPHRYRHAAASSIAELMPENMHVAVSLLGHADMRPIERYYNRSNPESAVRSYHDAVLAVRGR